MLRQAMELAIVAHKDQLRKYSGRPYVVHPFRVAMMIAPYVSTEAMIAALLHDTVEDTFVTHDQIRSMFGARVARMVFDLTESPQEVGNRAARKLRDRERLAAADWETQTIKAADIIDNTSSITERDPDFAPLYIEEARALMYAMKRAHPVIRDAALRTLDQAESR